ncbi:MAG TPA: efflux RND transporter periplasmic adaptor subunit [Acidobacteriota bacterium]|nr:efflux RND transporter periplasmic adaptor subunit [Acidobacteriota bacterium]
MSFKHTSRFLSVLMASFIAWCCGCGTGGGDLPVQKPSQDGQQTAPHSESLRLTEEQIRVAGIEFGVIQVKDLRDHLETTGSVEPDESRLAHIRPLSRGIIEKVFVRRGDRVAAGAPLISYDSIEMGEVAGEFLARKAALEEAESQREVTGKLLERGRELLKVEAIAAKDVEIRQAEFEQAVKTVARVQAELARAEEKLHRFGLNDEEIARLASSPGGPHRTASHKLLRAPFPGIIVDYEVAEGEVVDNDRELLTLVDTSRVWVLADVYEKDLGRLAGRGQVEVLTPAYPDQVFQGRLTYISDMLEPRTRTARVRCVVPNLDSRLKLGMFVTVRLPSNQHHQGLAVPRAAVQNVAGQDVVFEVSQDRLSFYPRPVRLGLESQGWVGVEGIAEGMEIVTQGSFYLKSQMQRDQLGGGHAH